jgi:negative regulator of replication initiation
LFSDTSIIPSRFDHVIVDGAVMFMMRFRSNEQSAAIHQNNFQDGIKAMRRLLLDDDLAIRSTVINRVAVNGR